MECSLDGQETQRLNFRLLHRNDFEDWLPLFREKNVAKFLGLNEALSPEELCGVWFSRVFKRCEDKRGVMNVLVEKTTGKMVGQCGLLVQTLEKKQILEIGYSILPIHRGNGYAIEAATKCKEFAFQNNLSETIYSITHIQNYSSKNVALRNGMRFIKSLENYNGWPVDVFGIEKKDFKLIKPQF